MTELLQLHQFIHSNSEGLADAIDVVPRKVDKHDMLSAILD